MSTAAVGRAQLARLGVAFALNGVTTTIWVVRAPALAARTGTTVGGFGVAVAALAVGGIAGSRLAPAVLRRIPPGRVTVIAGFALAGGLALRSLPTTLAWFAVTQVVAGLIDGVHDVAMNDEAVAVDRHTRIPVVNRLHAVWSMGAVAGGLAGAALAAVGTGVVTHLLLAAAVVAVANTLTLPLARPAHEAARVAAAGPDSPERAVVRWWRSPTLVTLAVMGVAGSLLEGAPLDWGALYVADELGRPEGLAALTTVTFTTGMVVARLGGDHLTHRWGAPLVLRVGAATAGVAVLVALAAEQPAVVLAAWAVIGAGVAGTYPALFVAAGRAPGVPSGAGIGAVSAVARTGFLLGPVLIGTIADQASLRAALLVPVGAAVVVVALAPAARRPGSG